MKKYFIFSLLLCSLVGLAQDKPKPPLTWKDVGSWKAIPAFGGTQLSPDGSWFAYVLNPNEGDAELVVRKTGDTTKIKYPLGAGTFFNMSFSDDSKWLAFKVYPKDKDKKAAAKAPAAKPLPDKVFLINLASKKKTEFDRVRSFDFNGEQSSVLALHLTPATPPGPPGADAAKGSDLLLYDLVSGKTQNIGNIADYAFNKKGDWLALTVDAAEKAGNGLWLRNMTSNVVMILDNDKASYKSLSWTEKGDGLALLKGIKDEKYKNDLYSVLGVKNFSGVPELVIYEPKKDTVAFPKGMTISGNRTPYWSEDLGRLYFGIAKTEPAKKETPKAENKKDTLKKESDAEKLAKIKADTSIKTIEDLAKAISKVKADTTRKVAAAPADANKEKPDMTIWHWQDKRLQSRQQVLENQDKNFNFIANYDIAAKKFLRLTDSSLKSLNVAPKQLYGIGSDITNYELDNNLDGQNYADIYVVDLSSGKRIKVIEKHYIPNFYASPIASPDGKKFLYWKDGSWMVYNMESQASLNISSKAGTSFVDVEDDHNVRKPPYDVFGWTNDSRFVLVGDGWDIWKLSVDGSATPQNLTKNGKAEQIRYQNRYVLDPEEKGIDLAKTQYIRTYGEWTKKSGFAALENGQLKTLLWEDTSLGSLTKAKKANAYVFTRQTFKASPEYYLSTSAGLENPQQVSQNTPLLNNYAWSPSVKLIDYKSDKGDKLQGALFLPAGYEAGKKYPTIIYYYEKLSQTLNSFANPSYPGGGWNPSVYTSNGYAVFIPDIVYKLNDPGMSAVWCVLPGVKAAIKTGIIDETKMGIHGHSWGGYQTSFLITQTNMFKAAAAGAPLTDMISMYNLIYKNSGSSNGAIFEASQGRLLPPWENWEAYNRNSPLYHVKKVNTPLLLLHNDADGAVDFTQGIEYYNALRRLKKPVVLIQYKGENHGLAKLPNRKDYAVRMMEFFDYHLKGKPAPDWLEKGIDRLRLDDHLEKRAMSEE
ncbi:prolyl oligopeptidase family serine peptidase [Emticicia sp. TH156]|uniref:prolyl oligopeptidase family serine peptidase n=1 Tax=Emticicia sp. TH156 TaxID=2067454 RepID=UPI000C7614AB|nr:prolyl oligopeptidase family serine peptidase [Emticicia sp. TH156]PLK46230.1 S9 family peptidase [Emticicia sp. TH156]